MSPPETCSAPGPTAGHRARGLGGDRGRARQRRRRAHRADYLEIPLGLIQAAVAYYGAFSSEIDGWIELNARESAAARATWLAGRAAITG